MPAGKRSRKARKRGGITVFRKPKPKPTHRKKKRRR